MKPKLDERQMQDAARIAGISFYVMYMVCAVFSIVFTVFFAFAIRRKAGPETEIRTAVLLFFAGMKKSFRNYPMSIFRSPGLIIPFARKIFPMTQVITTGSTKQSRSIPTH